MYNSLVDFHVMDLDTTSREARAFDVRVRSIVKPKPNGKRLTRVIIMLEFNNDFSKSSNHSKGSRTYNQNKSILGQDMVLRNSLIIKDSNE